MQTNEFVPVEPSHHAASYAHPSPCQLLRTGRVCKSRWASLLAASLVAPLATLVGCGTLGGLPATLAVGHASPAALTAAIPATPATISATPAAAGHPPLPADAAAEPPVTSPWPTSNTPQAARTTLAPVVPAAFRTPLAASHAQGQVCQVGTECPACAPTAGGEGSAEQYRNAQEYIFDGGDQQPKVIIKQDWTTAGVDPTDTVIYYETLAGSVCLQPSNRVPIYAPRFGAVRQVSGLQLATRATGTERILAPISVERFDEQNLASTVVQPVAPQGEQQVGLIDAFQENYATPPLEQVLPLHRMSAARVPFELVDPTRTGLITIQELVDVQEFIQNAQTWVNPESLAVEISNQAAILLKDTVAAQDVFVYELPDGCTMRIFKAASHTIANSGDIVSFTIRFDNAGVKPLGNAVVIDSLSPRLNYIQGSQQCSVGVRFSAEPNEVGSMVLRWEIEEPIAPSQGGVISFDCRVR